MKILMVTSKLPSKGKSLDMAPLVRQVESLRKIGAEVEILEVKGIKRLKYLQALPVLRRMAKEADIIHGHYAFCGWLARTAWSKPVVCSFMGDDLLGTPDHEGQIDTKGKLIIASSRKLARLVDAVIVKSAEMANIVAPVPVHVVPNGVDIEAFKPIDKVASRIKLAWDPNKRYVLFPGNPKNPRKGFELAQKAFDIANQKSNRELEMVVLWGVAPEDVPTYMNASDVMLMTSWTEGSPNVVKEAMACDLPVVSVPVGDVEELFDGVDGYVVCPRDEVLFGESLAEFVDAPVSIEGRAALLRMKLDTPNVAKKLIEIYSSVLAKKSPSKSSVLEKRRKQTV